MKKTILAIALVTSVFVSANAMATVPDLIPVQGTLATGLGVPVDGPTDITFALYAAETGGSALWTDTFTDVDVAAGFFTVYLGSNTALDFWTLLANPEIWLGITVESDGEMDRIQLAAVPFAIEAQTCEMVGSLTESDIATAWHDHDSDYAPISHTHAWSSITDIPAGFADGIDDTGGSTGVWIINQYPGTSTNVYRCGFWNATSAAVTVYVYAACMNTSSHLMSTTSTSQSLAADENDWNIEAACPAGTVVTGGGCHTNGPWS